jgi:hypothetical protein
LTQIARTSPSGQLFDQRQRRIGVEVHRGPEQLFFRLEAVEDGAFGDAGASRDLARRGSDAQLQEHLPGDVEQPLGRDHRGPAA